MAGYDDEDRRFEDRKGRDDFDRKDRDDFDDDRKDRNLDREQALQKFQLPATLLMVSGILYILAALGHMTFILVMLGNSAQQMEAMRGDPRFGNQGAGGMDPQTVLMLGVIFWGVVYFIACVLGTLIIVGALKMRNLKSRGLSMTACILGMMPCSGCCLLSLPMGIWGLVTLNSPEVKDMFR